MYLLQLDIPLVCTHLYNHVSVSGADVSKFNMPRKKVAHYTKRLPHKNEANPKDGISNSTCLTVHPLQRCRHSHQWNLEHHSCECYANDIVSWHTNKKLVHHCGEGENYHRSITWFPTTGKQWSVDMSSHKGIHRLIPCPPVSSDGDGVPPAT